MEEERILYFHKVGARSPIGSEEYVNNCRSSRPCGPAGYSRTKDHSASAQQAQRLRVDPGLYPGLLVPMLEPHACLSELPDQERLLLYRSPLDLKRTVHNFDCSPSDNITIVENDDSSLRLATGVGNKYGSRSCYSTVSNRSTSYQQGKQQPLTTERREGGQMTNKKH